MVSIMCYIIVMFGCINWLAIGFFQYDIVAGLFGYQGSIFSRIVYIIVGICAIYLTYSVIKHKGRISVKKLVKEEKISNDKDGSTTNKTDNLKTENNNNQTQNNGNQNINSNNNNSNDNMNNNTTNT